ncbi:anti-repressor SinI family protein [Ectobacillus antri]|uniref:Anti-repressor SinI family protein n=1 Tax=Ectobacillus antri TaxID=2486280 RepID=A0ABT6H336_9BACI|nr:anti-repressor SinI family protein [Ectobacillus antri]MDG4657496.1 anti-repressor SinI family protein [Ectobacillus antri]MDG5753809.1 anti-repressor SinI family protein [Ectobacillus antri]
MEIKSANVLDNEWIDLIVMALDLGIDPQEIRIFLESHTQ